MVSFEEYGGAFLSWTPNPNQPLAIESYFDAGTIHLCGDNFNVNFEMTNGSAIAIHGHGDATMNSSDSNQRSLIETVDSELTIVDVDMSISRTTELPESSLLLY